MNAPSFTVCDPRNGGHPQETDPIMVDEGFIDWRGERREVREVHVTKNGTQIELEP